MAKQATEEKSSKKQDAQQGEKPIKLNKKMLAGVMKDIDLCMMTTVTAKGELHSRPMSNNRNVDWDAETWFFSFADSSKVQELQANPSINLAYAVPDEIIFVSVTGQGEIVTDDAKKKELWYDDLAMWFPNGPEDDNVALIKVDAKFVHYWSKEGEGELKL